MDLYQKIMEQFSYKGLTTLEMARFLYLELAKNVVFSTKFQNTTQQQQAQMLSAKIDIHHMENTSINCVMWAQAYSQLLTAFNIPNRIRNQGHQFVEFNVQGKKWVADATTGSYNDIARIHNQDDPAYFGLSIYQSIDEKASPFPKYDKQVTEELSQIDEKLGYHNSSYQNLKKLKQMLEEVKSNYLNSTQFSITSKDKDKAKLKLELLFARLGTLPQGYYEGKEFVYTLEKILLTDEEMKRLSAKELKKTNKDTSVDIIQVITLKNQENKDYNYYLFSENTAIQPVDKNDVVRLSLLGYGLEEDAIIPGIIYPRNFIPGKIENSLSYKLKRKLHQKEIAQSPIAKFASAHQATIKK